MFLTKKEKIYHTPQTDTPQEHGYCWNISEGQYILKIDEINEIIDTIAAEKFKESTNKYKYAAIKTPDDKTLAILCPQYRIAELAPYLKNAILDGVNVEDNEINLLIENFKAIAYKAVLTDFKTFYDLGNNLFGLGFERGSIVSGMEMALYTDVFIKNENPKYLTDYTKKRDQTPEFKQRLIVGAQTNKLAFQILKESLEKYYISYETIKEDKNGNKTIISPCTDLINYSATNPQSLSLLPLAIPSIRKKPKFEKALLKQASTSKDVRNVLEKLVKMSISYYSSQGFYLYESSERLFYKLSKPGTEMERLFNLYNSNDHKTKRKERIALMTRGTK